MITSKEEKKYRYVITRDLLSIKKQINLYSAISLLVRNLKGGRLNKLGAQLSFIVINIKTIFSIPLVISIEENLVNGNMVGTLIAFKQRYNKNIVHLDAIAVEKNFRFKGFGSLLINQLEKELQTNSKKKVLKIYLKTLKDNNSQTLDFYKANGFIDFKKKRNHRFISFMKVLEM